MKSTKVKLAILSVLAVVSTSAAATGLVAIPAAGFTGTAYTSCNTTGNFGSSITTNPTTGANNTCAVFPANEAISPVAGFTLIANASRPVVMNNSYTGNVDVTVGSVTDRVWRNAAKTECIYGTKFVPANIDYWDGEVGTQYFEVNDIARGGFSGSGSVNAGYYVAPSTQVSPVYRIGRTYTSVQHRAYKYDNATNKAIVGTNYEDLPPSASGSTASINGEDSTIDATTAASTSAANQTAAVDSNWVDFTADAVWADDDGSTAPGTAMTYVQAACSSAAPATASNAIRLRQTAQEYARFIQVSVDGYVPPGGSATPTPSVPF